MCVAQDFSVSKDCKVYYAKVFLCNHRELVISEKSNCCCCFLIVVNSQLGDDSGRPRYEVYQVSANLFQC